MDKHKKQQIKLELCEWHMALCYEYKNVTSLEEVDAWYVAIHCW
jgi:phosphorylcholine metabolism protein LicD